MLKKIISMGMVLIVLFSFCACEKEKFVAGQVLVGINEEFRGMLETEKFTVGDFKWNNIKKIEYNWFFVNRAFYLFDIDITNQAIDDLQKLDFVSYCGVGVDGRVSSDSYLYIAIKEEFYEKFDAEDFTMEDFGILGRFEYRHAGVYYIDMITIFLKKQGKKYVFEAIEHFKTLDFVRNADQIIFSLFIK